ncbi:hypothetical protein CEXT_521441 [Caerostris extrusa]|uniref:Uncharacterized protein n=1 Tax=Caerostris extrusa TaxID=172846 RepID=A0AAV4RR32_CAEEX|nr:hypothetical protein CEXT_521441 [Caerostris extrusa]
MNHSLFDMTRCLFLDSGIPNVLCADTVSTACYLRNKCLSKGIQRKCLKNYGLENPFNITVNEPLVTPSKNTEGGYGRRIRSLCQNQTWELVSKPAKWSKLVCGC